MCEHVSKVWWFREKNENVLFLQKHDSYRTYEEFAQSDKNVCVSEKIPEAPTLYYNFTYFLIINKTPRPEAV